MTVAECNKLVKEAMEYRSNPGKRSEILGRLLVDLGIKPSDWNTTKQMWNQIYIKMNLLTFKEKNITPGSRVVYSRLPGKSFIVTKISEKNGTASLSGRAGSFGASELSVVEE